MSSSKWCAVFLLCASACAEAQSGELRSRPLDATKRGEPGEVRHEKASGYGIVVAPSSYRADRPAPLCLLLHGATGRPESILRRVASSADRYGIILVALKSYGTTWDAMRGDFGVDAEHADSLLGVAFATYNVDPKRLCVAGFSDGASYALSLGRVNGNLFTHVVAWSPGFMVGRPSGAKPAIFITHGTTDEILPIGSTTRRLVPQLERAGFRVELREFGGGHTIPAALLDSTFAWLMRKQKG